MHWLYLLACIACLGLAMSPKMPSPLVVLFLLGSLAALIGWVLGWLSARISSTSRDIGHIMGPDELRQLRQQAEARKAQPPREDDDAP